MTFPDIYQHVQQDDVRLDVDEECLIGSHAESVTVSCHDNDIISNDNDDESIVSSTSDLQLNNNVAKYEFTVFETETPSRGVSSIFICLYTLLGGYAHRYCLQD